MVGFKKATKSKKKGRIALCGPAGSGKTWTALEIATILAAIAKAAGENAGKPGCGRIAVVDSERSSAALYADHFDFDSLELDGNYSPREYEKALKMAADAGYPVVVVDSLSHAWSGEGGVLDQKDAMGGQFDAWRKLTPQHNSLVDAILTYPGHVIVTMRSKQAYAMEEYDDGGKKKTKVTKLGMAPIQRDGVEYEFDLVVDMNMENTLTVSKSRCESIPPSTVERRPGAKFAQRIADWLNVGAEIEPPVTADQKQVMVALTAELGITDKPGAFMISLNGGEKIATAKQGAAVIAELRTRLAAQEAARSKAGPTTSTGASKPHGEPSGESSRTPTTSPQASTTTPSTTETSKQSPSGTSQEIPDDPRDDDEQREAAE